MSKGGEAPWKLLLLSLDVLCASAHSGGGAEAGYKLCSDQPVGRCGHYVLQASGFRVEGVRRGNDAVLVCSGCPNNTTDWAA